MWCEIYIYGTLYKNAMMVVHQVGYIIYMHGPK